MTKDHVIPFRADDAMHATLLAIAKQEDRTVSKVVYRLVSDALKDRQCADAIRQADGRDVAKDPS